MLQLLYPIGLLALTGLIVPLIIHLWNVKQGKRIKIGSIALLGESSSLSSRSFRLTDWLLLILRLILLALLALLLAQPFLRTKENKTAQQGWILMPRAVFPKVYQSERKTIDSLVKLGYELHDFGIGFSTFSLKDTSASYSLAALPSVAYTSLFNQLNQQLPEGFPVWLFADHRLNKFGATLHENRVNLNWRSLKSTDTLSKWSVSQDGQTYEAVSVPASTSYHKTTAATAKPKLNVLIYDGNNRTEGTYLRAALEAIANFTQRNLSIRNWNGVGQNLPEADLGFWLSSQIPAPAFLQSIKKEGGLLRYAPGKAMAVKSVLVLKDQTVDQGHLIALYQKINAENDKGKVLWTDGFGAPLLTLDKANGINNYHFYSRFNPQWTDLVWKAEFVKALLPLVTNAADAADMGFDTNQSDQRVNRQSQSGAAKAIKTASVVKVERTTALSPWIWGLAFLLFFVERILSFRKKTKLNHG